MGKHIQTALGDELGGQGDLPSLRVYLLEHLIPPVGKQGGGGLAPAVKVVMVDIGGTAVNDGFMAACHPARAHLLLQNGGDQLGLDCDGTFPVLVAVAHLQGIDVVGAVWGNFNDRSQQSPAQIPVFTLRVNDDNVVIRGKGHILNGGLHGNGFAGAGHAQVEGVRGDEPFPVTDEQVFGNGVDTVRQAAGVLNFLHPEGHEDGGALGGEGSQGLYPAQAVGQDGIQAVLLLVAQGGKLAQVLPADGHQGFCVGVKLLQTVRNMDKGNDGKNHPLVSLGEVGQKFLGLSPQLLQLVGHGGGKVVLVVLSLLPSGDVCLDAQNLVLHIPHGLVGGNGQNVNGQHEAAGKVRQVGDHAVLNITGIVLQKEDTAHLISHLEVTGLKSDSVRADEIPEVESPADAGALVKGEVRLLARPEKVVEDAEPVVVGEGFGTGVQASEALGEVAVHSAEIGSGLLDLSLGDGERDVFLLD